MVLMANIIKYRGIFPQIHQSVFIANNATITGDVRIGENSSIWFNCVLRGDVTKITIGNNTNIQDNCIIHGTRPNHAQNKTGAEGAPVSIGKCVTIGHSAIIHACTIDDYAFVGMGSIVMDLAHIESNGMLGAGGVLTPKKIIKSGEIWAGNPAKFLRMMTQIEIDYIKISSENYTEGINEYK